jgi:hypothetical protein
MAASCALAQVFERPNLKRAWRWISNSPDTLCREFCGAGYADFSICADILLEEIADRLQRQIYEPSPARKVYLPKRDRTSRTYTVLSTHDRVVYQAFVNVMADRFDAIASSGYLSVSFGHLYAGRKSRTFYRDWRTCRRNYIGQARRAVQSGLEYTATFDVAACYDTIGHSVIKHFLTNLNLDRDFCELFCSYLSTWTVNQRGIPLDVGIPQGPLGSGLIAELVLHDFDVSFERRHGICYLRYVDDIRLFGRSERELELLVRELVEISKGIGLNPQSSKLDVHLVKDIDAELKSISSPREDWDTGAKVDQEKLVRRILELTRRSRVNDDTRFKYALSRAQPSARLNNRLAHTLDHRPDLLHPIARYFRKHKRLPRRAGEAFAARIRCLELAPVVRAALLDAADGRLISHQDAALNRLAKSFWSSRNLSGDIKLAAGKRLLKQGLISRTRLPRVLRDDKWWIRSEFVRSLSDDAFARRDLAVALATAVCDQDPDVALAAAARVRELGLKIKPQADLHAFAACVLKKAKPRNCGVDHALRKLLGGKIPRLRWRSFLGQGYGWFEEQSLECERCARTNVTAFVNALDALIDRLLQAIHSFDPMLGAYQLGNVGGVLQSKRLQRFYPSVLNLARSVHQMRNRSRYSHAVSRSTGRPTRTIGWDYLPRAKKSLVSALRELASAL